MKSVCLLVAHFFVSLAKLLAPGGTQVLIAENLLLKHQLLILKRSSRRVPNLTPLDRIVLGFCSLLMSPSRLLRAAIVVKPATILTFHRALRARKYRFLFSSTQRNKPGPKGPSTELIQAIVEMKRRNPRYGCPRIAQQLSAVFGITINKDVVRRVLATHYRPDPDAGGPSWLTFLGQMRDSLWSIDLFRCESLTLQTHWVLVVMDQFTRRIIGFGVHRGEVDGAALCQMFTKATAARGVPTYLSSDHHPVLTSQRWKRKLRCLGIKEIKTIPYVPVSHPFVERLIGTIRREYLDQVLFWNARDVERKLEAFTDYYNRHRVHSSLQGQTPAARGGEPGPCRVELTHFTWQRHCQGLFQTPMAA